MLINTTDICSSFIRCPRPGQVEQRCRARPGAAWHRQVQGLYGAFREAYLTSLPPGPASPDLSAARVAVRSVCAERMDLVVSHRCNEPVLAPLAQLLAQVPLGVCVRVLVLERCLALSGRTADILPSMDARDQLFDVRRIAAPRAQGVLEAYQSWAAGSKDTVSSVIFAPDAWHLQIQDVRSCATHLLSSSQRVGTELVTVQLGSLRVVHLAAVAVSVVTQAQIDAAMSASNLRTARVTRTRDYSKCQLGLLARLLSAAARAKTTARLEPAAVPRLGFHGEEQFALSCFDPDFMQNNRALLPLPAAQSRLWCDQNATTDGVSRFDSLVALTQQQGGSSHRAGAGTRHSAQSQQRCDPQQLLQTNLLPAGWFSTLHGLVKPLSHALRSGKTLITPAMQVFLAPLPNSTMLHPTFALTWQEFTTNDLCEGGRRDLGCFFRPLAPSCDQSVEVLRPFPASVLPASVAPITPTAGPSRCRQPLRLVLTCRTPTSSGESHRAMLRWYRRCSKPVVGFGGQPTYFVCCCSPHPHSHEPFLLLCKPQGYEQRYSTALYSGCTCATEMHASLGSACAWRAPARL